MEVEERKRPLACGMLITTSLLHPMSLSLRPGDLDRHPGRVDATHDVEYLQQYYHTSTRRSTPKDIQFANA